MKTREELSKMTKAQLDLFYTELTGTTRKFANKTRVIEAILNRYRIISRAKAFRVQ